MDHNAMTPQKIAAELVELSHHGAGASPDK